MTNDLCLLEQGSLYCTFHRKLERLQFDSSKPAYLEFHLFYL